MNTHEEKVDRISMQLKQRKSTKPVSLKKKSVSHEVPKPNDKRHLDEKIDVSDLHQILHIDPEKKICVAEPGVTFVDLVKASMEHNLVPAVVPELKTITIGGAVAGCSIESMSYKLGGFHDSCLEYEVITAKGEVLTCTPENEHKLVFQMMHGTFGTLGIISKLTFKLIPAKKYVHVKYKKYTTLEDYMKATRDHYDKKDVEFMDGIIHSPKHYVLSVGNFVDKAPYSHSYDWMRVYYQSTAKRKEDYLKTPDYFFRYDKGVTNAFPKSFLGRLFLGWFMGSTELLKLAKMFRRWIPDSSIPTTVDLFLPFKKLPDFMKWYQKEVNFFPLWYVPYKIQHKYEWVADELLEGNDDPLFVDIAVYGFKGEKGKNYYRMFEKILMELKAIKTLISGNYYTEEEFWKTWNKSNFETVKKKTDPDNVFRGLYEKTCRSSRGL